MDQRLSEIPGLLKTKLAEIARLDQQAVSLPPKLGLIRHELLTLENAIDLENVTDAEINRYQTLTTKKDLLAGFLNGMSARRQNLVVEAEQLLTRLGWTLKESGDSATLNQLESMRGHTAESRVAFALGVISKLLS